MNISKELKDDLEDAIDQGKHEDYLYNGEDEFRTEYFETKEALTAVTNILESLPVYTKEELYKLFDDYLATEDDEDLDELYRTQRSFSNIGIEGFKEWLDTKTNHVHNNTNKQMD